MKNINRLKVLYVMFALLPIQIFKKKKNIFDSSWENNPVKVSYWVNVISKRNNGKSLKMLKNDLALRSYMTNGTSQAGLDPPITET